jgi:uncharacterized protein YjiS (DUF1127 family)
MKSSYTEIGQRAYRQSGPSLDALIALVRSVFSTAQTWRARARDRRYLASRGERELLDMGTCWAQVAYEASKPFWRE